MFATALLSGPVTNTLENTERAAASLLCGAELAANQTQELMQRAATPLYSKSLLWWGRFPKIRAHHCDSQVYQVIPQVTTCFTTRPVEKKHLFSCV